MPRSLFEMMEADNFSRVGPKPRLSSGQLSMGRKMVGTKPVERVEPEFQKVPFMQRVKNFMSTPMTPTNQMYLNQLAQAMAPEGSWQGKLAESTGASLQNQIYRNYAQAVLSGEEPVKQQAQFVPLEVQLGVRKMKLDEEQQQFERERREKEFDVGTALELNRQAMEEMDVSTRRALADLQGREFEQAKKEFEAQFANRRKFDSWALGVYNWETGEYVIDPTMLELKRLQLQTELGAKDYEQARKLSGDAIRWAKQKLANDGLVLFNEEGQMVKIQGDPRVIQKTFLKAYKEWILDHAGGQYGQLHVPEEQLQWLAEMDFARIMNEPPPPSEDEIDQGEDSIVKKDSKITRDRQSTKSIIEGKTAKDIINSRLGGF